MNGILKSLIVGLLCEAGLAAAAAGLPNTVEFKYIHTPGKVSRTKVTTKVIGSMKMPDPLPEQKTAQIIEQELRATCLKVNPDGSAVYEMQFPVIHATTDMGGRKMDFRSDAPTTQGSSSLPGVEGIGKFYTAMTKIKFTAVLDRNGRPLKVVGFAEGMRRALADLSGPMKTIMETMLKAMDDDNMRDQMDARADFLSPRGTLRIGDTWKTEREAKFPIFNGKIRTVIDCTLLAVEEFRGRPCAKIGIKCSMQSLPRTPNAAAASQPNDPFANMDMNLTASDGNGVAYWDYEHGELVQSRQTIHMTSEAVMKNLPAPTGKGAAKTTFRVTMKALNATSMDLLDSK